MDKWFHPTLYCACDYLSTLRFELNHDCKRGPWGRNQPFCLMMAGFSTFNYLFFLQLYQSISYLALFLVFRLVAVFSIMIVVLIAIGRMPSLVRIVLVAVMSCSVFVCIVTVVVRRRIWTWKSTINICILHWWCNDQYSSMLIDFNNDWHPIASGLYFRGKSTYGRSCLAAFKCSLIFAYRWYPPFGCENCPVWVQQLTRQYPLLMWAVTDEPCGTTSVYFSFNYSLFFVLEDALVCPT